MFRKNAGNTIYAQLWCQGRRDTVTRFIVRFCSLVYTKRVFERMRHIYSDICTISRNAFVVRLVRFDYTWF
jgi:hypothetical protein